MQKWYYFIFIFLFSCNPGSQKEIREKFVAGNWLVVYPDHQLRNDRQETIYAAIQDSIVGIKGLKLIRFLPAGGFAQTDSLTVAGKWGLVEDSILYVRNGGHGFENFNAIIVVAEGDKMELSESLLKDGQKINIVWHLKRVGEGEPGAELFSDFTNEWRIRPVKAETEREIRERLSAMLNYYSVYFRLVSEEASYFMGSRIFLPFQFYQHAIGLKPLNENGKFASFFFSIEQAKQAHHLLEEAMQQLGDEFPSGKNFVIEYSLHMNQLSKEIAKE